MPSPVVIKYKRLRSYIGNKLKRRELKSNSRSSHKNSGISNDYNYAKIISYANELLEEYGAEISSEFFKHPEEPAKRTIDTYGDSEWTGYGDISMSAYDTAWLAMVPNKTYKESASAKEFLLAFPECFRWLINCQDEFGGWCNVRGAGAITPVLAGLLALCHFRTLSGEFFEAKLNDTGVTIVSFFLHYTLFHIKNYLILFYM